MIVIKCIQNEGFEDQLTPSSDYQVKEIGANSFLIVNDKAESRWYGAQHFNLALAA